MTATNDTGRTRRPEPGPHAVRTLASAAAVFQQVLTDVAGLIHQVVEQSTFQAEAQYAGLLGSMVNVEAGDMRRVVAQSQSRSS